MPCCRTILSRHSRCRPVEVFVDVSAGLWGVPERAQCGDAAREDDDVAFDEDLLWSVCRVGVVVRALGWLTYICRYVIESKSSISACSWTPSLVRALHVKSLAARLALAKALTIETAKALYTSQRMGKCLMTGPTYIKLVANSATRATLVRVCICSLSSTIAGMTVRIRSLKLLKAY